MLKTILLATFAILPLVYSSVLTDEELKALSEEVLGLGGFLYKLPQGDQQRFIEYAREKGLQSKDMTYTSRWDITTTYFNQNRLQQSNARTHWIPEVVQSKKITLDGWKVNLCKLYDHCAKMSKANAVRGFVDAITIAIVADYEPIKDYITVTDSRTRFEKLNQTFGPKCEAVTTGELFKMDTDKLCRDITVLLKKRPNAKNIILEAVTVAIVEILRVTPCVLDSVQKPEHTLSDAFVAFGVPNAHTILDPLPALRKQIGGDKSVEKYFSAVTPKVSDVNWDFFNAKIRVKRFLETVKRGTQNTDDLIVEFIKGNKFAEGSLLGSLQFRHKVNQNWHLEPMGQP